MCTVSFYDECFTFKIICSPLQVDVIESQWNILQSHIQDSHDFTELVGFHQE
jgi:gamma-tubulin complex component 4